MITVYFYYWTVASKGMQHGSQSFDDVKKAFRFIKKVKKSENMMFDSYVCIDKEDNDWLSMKL